MEIVNLATKKCTMAACRRVLRSYEEALGHDYEWRWLGVRDRVTHTYDTLLAARFLEEREEDGRILSRVVPGRSWDEVVLNGG